MGCPAFKHLLKQGWNSQITKTLHSNPIWKLQVCGQSCSSFYRHPAAVALWSQHLQAGLSVLTVCKHRRGMGEKGISLSLNFSPSLPCFLTSTPCDCCQGQTSLYSNSKIKLQLQQRGREGRRVGAINTTTKSGHNNLTLAACSRGMNP